MKGEWVEKEDPVTKEKKKVWVEKVVVDGDKQVPYALSSNNKNERFPKTASHQTTTNPWWMDEWPSGWKGGKPSQASRSPPEKPRGWEGRAGYGKGGQWAAAAVP